MGRNNFWCVGQSHGWIQGCPREDKACTSFLVGAQLWLPLNQALRAGIWLRMPAAVLVVLQDTLVLSWARGRAPQTSALGPGGKAGEVPCAQEPCLAQLWRDGECFYALKSLEEGLANCKFAG